METTERLVFDLAHLAGEARVELVKLGRRNIRDAVLTCRRQKSKLEANLPGTTELRAVIDRTPHIAPAFILHRKGKPYTAESMGNLFPDAANAAGMVVRLHGLRKAFGVYWAEKGVSTHQIAALAGHPTLERWSATPARLTDSNDQTAGGRGMKRDTQARTWDTYHQPADFTPYSGENQRSGEPDRIRTCDPLIKSQLLYQLSYRPTTPRLISQACGGGQGQKRAALDNRRSRAYMPENEGPDASDWPSVHENARRGQ